MHLPLGLFSAFVAVGCLAHLGAQGGSISDAAVPCLWSFAAGVNLALAYATYVRTWEDT